MPTITSLDPVSLQAGGPGATLTVTGSGFVNGSAIIWNGSPRPTTLVSPTQLTTPIQPADIATPATVEIAVTTPSPGGGTTSPTPIFVTSAAVTVSRPTTATSTSPTGTASASVGPPAGTAGSTSATATGAGTLAVATYSADPGLAPTFDASGGYFDVSIAPGSSFSSVSIQDCSLNGGNTVTWFNGTAWQAISPTTAVTLDATGTCATIKLDASTQPSISQLTGTVFAAARLPRLTSSLTTADGQPYTAGTWSKQPVTVTFSCAPTAVTKVSPPQTLMADGANQSVTGTCQDGVGNKVSTQVSGIDVDRTPPSIAFTGTLAYTVDEAVNVTCQATDATSGVASTTCGTATGGFSGPAYQLQAGPNVVGATATDKAGNSATASTTITVNVTYASLCSLTAQFLGPKVASQPQVGLICSRLRQLQQLGVNAPPGEKAKLIQAYDQLVNGLVVGKLLTPEQGTILTRFAAALP